MRWWQTFLVSVASLALAFVAGHFLWPATTTIEIPGRTVLDSAATQALTVRLDSVRAALTRVHVRVARDQKALTAARGLYRDLLARVDSMERAAADTIDIADWPAARYDTTLQRTMHIEVAIGDSTERRDVLQEIRLSGEHVLPPFNVFRAVSLEVTPSAVYFSRQLPGQKVERQEVVRWSWLPAGIGYVAGTVVTTLIALVIAGAAN